MKKWSYYFFLLFFVTTLFLGYSSIVDAEEQKTGLGFLNNSNVIISNKKGVDIQLSRNVANTVDFNLNQIIFSSTYNIQANTVYEYEIETYNQYLKNIDEVSILSDNGICTSLGLSGLNSSYVRVRFTCTSSSSTFTIGLSNSNDNNITDNYNIGWSSIYLWSIIDTIDLGPIINNQSENTQNIIANQNDNNEALIENDNENTQKIIDSNKENFNTCIKNYFPYPYLFSNGDVNNGITITINDDKSVTLSGHSGSNYSFINFARTTEFMNTNINNNNHCSNGYCLTNELSYTASNGLIWYYVGANRDINITIYPMITKDSIPSEYIQPQEKYCTNKLDEQNETSKGILGKLGDVFNVLNPTSDSFFGKKLVELMVNGIKSLFVPEQEEMSDLIDDFKSTMETKLGAIYQVADLLVSVLRSVLSPASSNSCMTFPEIKDPMFDKLLIEQTDYCFDSLRSDFGFVFTLSDMIISIVCTLAFANMLYKKYEGFIGGNASDY